MSDTPLDTLFMIAEESELLDQVEMALRATGGRSGADAANGLVKLQQDVGIEINKAMGLDDSDAGPTTAALHKNFQPVTPARLYQEVTAIRELTSEGALQEKLSEFIERLALSKPTDTTPTPPFGLGM